MGNLYARVVALALVCSVLGSGTARAQPITEAEIPPALRPWVPWVLADDDTYGCTANESAMPADRGSNPICVWPGELRIELRDDGARFSLTATADRRFPLTLPGGPRAWPTSLTVDGRATPIASDADRPIVFLDSGSHRVEGVIGWTDAPETLAVPDDVVRIVIVENGAARTASRGTSGEIWLRAAGATDDEDDADAPEPEAVHFEVHRKLTDGSPIELVTRITVRAAGRARELRLGAVLPEGAVPIAVDSAIPARLDEAGALTLQLHAGTFQVEIRAFVPSPDAHLRRPALVEPWPEQEVWVWAPNEAFRQVEIVGASAIDPERTSLPADWRSYSAYIVDSETELSFDSVRRGEPSPPPNALSLSRTIWLDATGDGATMRDSLDLEMHRGFRVELVEGQLGRVSILGDDQLITRAVEGGAPGVEVRATDGQMTAEWRFEGAFSSFLAVGWSEDAQSTDTTLNLPPGWELVHAFGVDRASASWTERWTLLGFFALLLIAIVVGRVLGWRWGLVALVGIGLANHEGDAPRWIWLVLASTLALHRALGARPVVPWIRRAYLALLLFASVAAVTFATAQLRLALYPTLSAPYLQGGADSEPTAEWLEEDGRFDDAEGGTGRRHRDDEGMMGEESPERTTSRYGIEGPVDSPDPHMAREQAREDPRLGVSYGSTPNWLDPSAVVQTGYGVPTWSWKYCRLELDGPVGHDHRISLLLSPPWMTRLVSLLEAVLALALLYAMIRFRPVAPSASDRLEPTGHADASATAIALVLALALPGQASAQPAAPTGPIPSTEMLNALGERLHWPPDCGEHCAEASAMRISVRGDRLAIDIDVGARAVAAYPLPGPSETWAPDRVTIDGAAADGLVRLGSGFVHVRVPAGVHVVHVEGTLSGRDRITLALGRLPRSLALSLVGWETNGTDSEERVPESVQLSRSADALPEEATAPGTETEGVEEAEAGEPPPELPTWLEVRRSLDIGVRWTISSTVTRRSPTGAPTVVRIPLLRGESVTDSTVVAEDGFAVVTLGQHDTELSWTSVLEAGGDIVLSAPPNGHVSEVWSISCSTLWHCDTAGLSPTESSSGNRWVPRFDPWPGETLTVTMTRPVPMSGQSTTIDSAELSVAPGARLTSSTLALSVRTSVSTPLTIALPLTAEVRELTVDGTTRAIQREAETVTIALQPGAHHVRLGWQDPAGWSAMLTTPAVTLGSAAVNLSLDVTLTSDRWLLWIIGPSWGPAVLIWPYAAMLLLLAFALSRRRTLMPKLHQWALLGLGLTQVPPAVTLFVAGWFFLMEWRAEAPLPGTYRFNLRQVVIVGYTLLVCGAIALVIRAGLLGEPGMDIEGPGTSGDNLHFFADRSAGALPTALLVTVPVYVFRILMFAWAAWLAVALVRWARTGWSTFADGGLWRSGPPAHHPLRGSAPAAAAPAAAAPAAAAPAAAAPAAAAPAAAENDAPPPDAVETKTKSDAPPPPDDDDENDEPRT